MAAPRLEAWNEPSLNSSCNITTLSARSLEVHYRHALPYFLTTNLILCWIIAYGIDYFSRGKLDARIPWVGVQEYKFLSRFRASLNSVFHTDKHLIEGLQDFLSKDECFALPNIFTGADIILPHKYINWLLEQPISVLSQRETNKVFLEADYTMLHPVIQSTTVHERIIRRDLPRNLNSLTRTMVDELDRGWRKWWSTSNSWHSVDLFQTACEVMYRSSNRLFVGSPLCHDPDFLTYNMRLFKYILPVAGMINMTPSLLKPITGRLLTLYDKYNYWQCSRKTIPLIRQRIEQFGDKIKRGISIENEPNDYIQWALQDVLPRGQPEECDPDTMARRLAVLQFAGQVSSVMALTNLIWDLASMPDSREVWNILHDEIQATLKECGGWSKPALMQMHLIESTIKESLRLGGITGRGVSKIVMDPNGLTLPNGFHAPCGTQVGVSSYTTHRDPNLYPNPQAFEPFRFVGSEKYRGRCPPMDSGAPLNRTSETYLAFSHGSNSCPGRFFASYQIKLHLAYLVLNYEIQPITRREAHMWFQNATGPSLSGNISVRRRTLDDR